MKPARFFGQDGPFGQACDDFRARKIPPDVLKYGMDLGDPAYIGYLVGYCLAREIERRKMEPATQEELQYIGESKFPLGGPAPFIAGFKSFRVL